MPYPPHLLAPIGILDPEGTQPNPLTGRPYENLHAHETDDQGNPQTYARIANTQWKKLNVYTERVRILKDLHDYQVVIAESGTGTGKTVIFPKLALHAVGYDNRVLCAIPKQIPCKGAGEYAARCMDVQPGREVGHFYKGDRSYDRHRTKLLFSTSGSIAAMMRSNPFLDNENEKFDCLLIDEVHERTKDIDDLLMNAREILRRRPEMKIVVMSATLDLHWYATYFREFRVKKLSIEAPPTYPRCLQYLSKPLFPKQIDITKMQTAAADLIVRILDKPPVLHDPRVRDELVQKLIATRVDITTRAQAVAALKDGDILVFLPSVKAAADDVFKEVRKKVKQLPHVRPFYCTKLESASRTRPLQNDQGKKVDIVDKKTGEVRIEGLMVTRDGKPEPASEQDVAVAENMYLHHPDNDPRDPYVRKVILATNVAESSVTFKGALTYVVDSGVSQDNDYLPKRMETTLTPKYVAQGPIVQREGRTGRTCPGVCYHLYTKTQFDEFPAFAPPEMSKVEDLPNRILLRMMQKGWDSVDGVHKYFDDLPEPPPRIYRNAALRMLISLQAIEPPPLGEALPTGTAKRTFLGRAMSPLGAIPPHQAKALIASYYYNCLNEMADIVAFVGLLNGKGLEELCVDPRKQWKNKSTGVHPDLVSSGSTNYGDHITLLRTYNRYRGYRTVAEQRAFCKKHNVKGVTLAKVSQAAQKIKSSVEKLLERTDNLLCVNEDDVLDTEAMEARAERPDRGPRRSSRKQGRRSRKAHKAHGGTFEVATDFAHLDDVNPSGEKDLAVLYALYPECQRSVRQTLLAIVREQRPGDVNQPSLAVLYAEPGSAREALSDRIRTLPVQRFKSLGTSERDAVLHAYRATIKHRKRDMAAHAAREAAARDPTATSAPTTHVAPVVDDAEAKNHAHWLRALEASFEKARTLHWARLDVVRDVRRRRVKEMIRPFFSDLPDSYHESEWRNPELRVMRAMAEGYYVHMGLRVDDPAKKKYVLPFPSEQSVATVSKRSVLFHKPTTGPVCLFETLFTQMKPELVLVTTPPPEVMRSMKGLTDAMVAEVVNSKWGGQLELGADRRVTRKAGVVSRAVVSRRKGSRKKKRKTRRGGGTRKTRRRTNYVHASSLTCFQ